MVVARACLAKTYGADLKAVLAAMEMVAVHAEAAANQAAAAAEL